MSVLTTRAARRESRLRVAAIQEALALPDNTLTCGADRCSSQRQGGGRREVGMDEQAGNSYGRG